MRTSGRGSDGHGGSAARNAGLATANPKQTDKTQPRRDRNSRICRSLRPPRCSDKCLTRRGRRAVNPLLRRIRSVQAATLQKRENFEIAAGVRGALRRGAVSVGQFRVGTVGQQRPDDLDMTVLDRQDQSPVSFSIECVHVNITDESALQFPGIAVLGRMPEAFGRNRRGCGGGRHRHWCCC